VLDQIIGRRSQAERRDRPLLRPRIPIEREGNPLRAAVSLRLTITDAHLDWKGTRVGFELARDGQDATRVRFYHQGLA
jgi:hypothetical protein